jgi:flagellar hook-length control protein FliK
MSAVPVSVLRLLDVSGAHSTTASGEIKEQEDFQSLLDIRGAPTASRKENSLLKEDKQDNRREIIAAPIDSQARSAENIPPAQPENPDDIVRRQDNESRSDKEERLAEDDRVAAQENSAQRAKPAKSSEKQERPDRSEKNVEDAGASAVAQESGSKESPASSELQAAQNVTSEQSTPLAGPIKALRELLATFLALKESPVQGGVIIRNMELRSKVGIAAVNVAGVSQNAVVSAGNQAGIEPVPTVTNQQDSVFVSLVEDIEKQLKAIQTALENTTTQATPAVFRPLFTQLTNKLGELSAYIQANPETQAVDIDSKNLLVQNARALLTQIKEAIGKKPAIADKSNDAAQLESVADLTVKAAAKSLTLPVVDGIERALLAPAVAPSAATTSVQSGVSATTAIEATAFNGAGAQSDTESNNPSLQQFAGSVRSVEQSQSTQTNTATDFARILQQARMPVVDQVIVHMKAGLENGDSKINIRLHPEELGRLEIKLNVDMSGKTVVSITADNKSTLDLLQRDARGLERALADAGLKTDAGSLSFNLRGGQHEQGQAPPRAAENYLKTMPEETPDASVISRSYVISVTEEGLDIRV